MANVEQDFYLVGQHKPVVLNLESNKAHGSDIGAMSIGEVGVKSVQSDFIESIAEGAQEVQLISGMFASVTIAQAILETGWGKYHPVDADTGEESYNLFGIKAADGEPYVRCITWEEYSSLPSEYIRYEQLASGNYKVWIYDHFRKFESFADCIIYRAQWLTRSKYWTKACTAETADLAIHYLQNTGYGVSYATDSNYESQIVSIMKSYNLYQYNFTREEEEMIQELKNTLDTAMRTLEAHKEEIDDLRAQLDAATAKKSADEQQVADWAQAGYDFVTSKGISDGTRPEDGVTRQEVWTMVRNYDNIKSQGGADR